MFWKTRPAPADGENDPHICAYAVRKGRACARPATWHHAAEHPDTATGYADYSSCDRHAEWTMRRVLDSHHIGPVCTDYSKWWHVTTADREGFCYHPEEDMALHRELAGLHLTGGNP